MLWQRFSILSLLLSSLSFRHSLIQSLSRFQIGKQYFNALETGKNYVHNEKRWFDDGLMFKCTGCGKCCKTQGEVWMDVNEVVSATELLNIGLDDFFVLYVENFLPGWVQMKNKEPVQNVTVYDQSCIFLDQDGKTCSIYQARPIQCRTYPFWPRIISNLNAWESEMVVPDETIGKHWSFEAGGCEGINQPQAMRIDKKSIQMNSNLYKISSESMQAFPSGDDKRRFMAAASLNEVYRANEYQYPIALLIAN